VTTVRPLERLKLILKFKVMTSALHGRKKLYDVLGGSGRDLKINIGGGLFFRPGWKVLDHSSAYYPFARRFIDYDLDLCTPAPFPFPDNSVSFFYSAHTLEHIPDEFCPHIFAEIYRCLRPGGALRVCMPDYDGMRRAVTERDATYFGNKIVGGLSFEEAVVEQIATERVGKVSTEKINADFARMTPEEFAESYTRAACRETQKTNGGFHINWFTGDKLARVLGETGFSEVYRSSAQASRFEELRGEGGPLTAGDVFEIKRMLGIDTTIPEKSLYVEAIK
jgi:SAM-dependent methyltransferase